MSFADWPSSANVVSAIGTLTFPSWVTVSNVLAQTILDFERSTGYLPFKIEANNSDTRFSNYLPSGREIAFQTGYATLEELYVDCSTDTDGTLLEEGTDYFLNPQNGTPIEGVTLFDPRRFSPFSIRAVGKKGFGATIPVDAWDAVLWKTALPAFEKAQKDSGGTIQKIKQGPVELTFGGAFNMSEATGGRYGSPGEIEEFWHFVTQKYRRVSF